PPTPTHPRAIAANKNQTIRRHFTPRIVAAVCDRRISNLRKSIIFHQQPSFRILHSAFCLLTLLDTNLPFRHACFVIKEEQAVRLCAGDCPFSNQHTLWIPEPFHRLRRPRSLLRRRPSLPPFPPGKNGKKAANSSLSLSQRWCSRWWRSLFSYTAINRPSSCRRKKFPGTTSPRSSSPTGKSSPSPRSPSAPKSPAKSSPCPSRKAITSKKATCW